MKKREKLAIVRQHYPNAVSTIDAVNKTILFVEDVLDLEPGQVMLADSLCCDDVNSIQYPARATEFLGPFKLGGLDGFPFVGLTGMKAFSSHVPDDGAVFIYYGPHIGISKDGNLGKIHRIGQYKSSDCCGAAMAGLQKLTNHAIVDGHVNDLDYQMNTLEQILLQQGDRILDAPIPLKEATEVIYEAIDKRIRELLEQTKFKCRYIILTGAILINGDSDMGSFTSTKHAELIDVATGESKNLMFVLEDRV